jgi:pSer/pThr/pTyr-binding forkhead associated (FHA) protein
MPARLTALDGGPGIPLDSTPIVVGRHPLCDVRLTSIRVSRRHCCIHVVDGEVEVRDLGSTNGILINGRQSQSGRLRPGDVLSIAHLRFRLEHGLPTWRSWLLALKSSGPSAEFPTGLDDDG